MVEKLCILTIGFAYNRQGIIDYLEKIIPKNVEIFLFLTKECRGKYHSKRIKIMESDSSKYFSFFKLRRFCKKNKIERIINLGSLPQEGFLMVFASLLTNTDFLCYLVINPLEFSNSKINLWSIKSFFQTLFLFPLSFFPKKFLVCSKDIIKFCKRYLIFVKNKIFQLPDTVNIKIFSPKNKITIRKKLNISKNQKVIIFVGRIEYAKGSDIILEIAKNNLDKTFLLVGKLADDNIKKENLTNIKIISSMNRKKLSEYYNAADLCLFPSRAEGFGLVPRESMACGTPAIVSDVPGLRMIENSIKVPLNAEIINKEIKNFFNLSIEERTKLSRKSRGFIIDECSEEVCKDLYINKILN